jgi:hypothetical protein
VVYALDHPDYILRQQRCGFCRATSRTHRSRATVGASVPRGRDGILVCCFRRRQSAETAMSTVYLLIKLCGGVRGAVLAVLLALATVALGVQTYRVAKTKQESVEALASVEKGRHAAWVAYHAAKDNYNKALNETRGDYVAKLEEAQTQLAAAERRIAAGELRPRFKCPSTAGQQPGSSTGSDGGEERGLLDADAEFLVRIAADADKVANQLKLAQDTIRQLQLVCSAGDTDG